MIDPNQMQQAGFKRVSITEIPYGNNFVIQCNTKNSHTLTFITDNRRTWESQIGVLFQENPARKDFVSFICKRDPITVETATQVFIGDKCLGGLPLKGKNHFLSAREVVHDYLKEHKEFTTREIVNRLFTLHPTLKKEAIYPQLITAKDKGQVKTVGHGQYESLIFEDKEVSE